ncbi:MAG: universal stress protein [Planctomycetota bacterium]
MTANKRFIIAVAGVGDEAPHIRTGLDWARASGATVRFVHVVRMLLVPTGYAVGDVMPMNIKEADACSDQEALQTYVERVLGGTPADVPVDYLVLRGDDVEELVELSGACQCMVLGHHHINGFLHIFTQSVDERLINRAQCPVLIVPEHGGP